MRKGTPNQFIRELMDKIDELKDESIESARVIIDEEDVIEADEEIVEDVEEVNNEDYLPDLYTNVENTLADMVQGVAWSSDDENIYMDVSFTDDHIITFTIPKEDLLFDLEHMDTDVNYICTAVREANSDESLDVTSDTDEEVYEQEVLDDDEITKNILEEYDLPAYL